MSNEGERLATLEAESKEAIRQRNELRAKLEAQDIDLKAIRSDVHEINEKFSGHIGFLRGLIFAFTVLGAAIGAIVSTLWNKLTGQ